MTAVQLHTPWGRLPASRPIADNDNLPRVVAFAGLAGSGKTTAANYLVDMGYTRVKFATPLKDMLRSIGLTEEHIEGRLKEQSCDMLQGKSPRHAMQTLGAEWGRDCIGDGFWVGLWRIKVDQILETGGRVVCDDCRYPNEATAIRRMGGDIYRLVGRATNQASGAGTHSSEKIDFIPDCVIENVTDLTALHNRIDRELRRYC